MRSFIVCIKISSIFTPRKRKRDTSYKNVWKFNYDVVAPCKKIGKRCKIWLSIFLFSLIFSQISTSVQKGSQNALIFAATNPVRTLASVVVVSSWKPMAVLAKVSHTERYLWQIFTNSSRSLFVSVYLAFPFTFTRLCQLKFTAASKDNLFQRSLILFVI